MVFTTVSIDVVVVVVCKHDNFRKNYRIGLKFWTPFEGPKRKDKFVDQPFSSNGSDFIHKNALVNIKNSIFPPKYTRHGKNVKKQNSSFQRDLAICWWPFFHSSYIFCLLMENVIKNEKFLLFIKKIYKFTAAHFLIRYAFFVLIVKNVIKNEKSHFVPNLCEIRKKC